MLPMFYSMSLNAVVVVGLIENPTLSAPAKLSSIGFLSAKDQFIEETRSYGSKMSLTYDGNFHSRFFIETGTSEAPIPDPVSSMSFDSFDYYTPSSSLVGLNSGSNEWNNTTPLAAWNARIAFQTIIDWDDFNSYTVNSSLSASLPGLGEGDWKGVFDYYARTAFRGIKNIDAFSFYNTGTLNGDASGSLWDNSPWLTVWSGRRTSTGIWALDDFSTSTTGSNIDGQNGQPEPNYSAFSGPWVGRSFTSGSG